MSWLGEFITSFKILVNTDENLLIWYSMFRKLPLIFDCCLFTAITTFINVVNTGIFLHYKRWPCYCLSTWFKHEWCCEEATENLTNHIWPAITGFVVCTATLPPLHHSGGDPYTLRMMSLLESIYSTQLSAALKLLYLHGWLTCRHMFIQLSHLKLSLKTCPWTMKILLQDILYIFCKYWYNILHATWVSLIKFFP
jgi:hypothetical protein